MLTLITVWIANRLRPRFGLKAETIAEWLMWLGGMLALCLAITAIVLGARSCYIRKQVKETSAKVEAAKVEAIKAQAEVEKLEKDAEATDAEIREAKEKAKEVEKELLEAVKEDSGTRNADIDASLKRFCGLYPEDSLCV